MRIRHLGMDPGLVTTGWGIVDVDGTRLTHVANGEIAPDPTLPMAERLAALRAGLAAVLALHRPDRCAVEEAFVARNPGTALKLGMARGMALLAAAEAGVPVAEYAARLVKKAVVGNGGAEKAQVQTMVRHLLPAVRLAGDDAADALAVAICHAHHAGTEDRVAAARARALAS